MPDINRSVHQESWLSILIIGLGYWAFVRLGLAGLRRLGSRDGSAEKLQALRAKWGMPTGATGESLMLLTTLVIIMALAVLQQMSGTASLPGALGLAMLYGLIPVPFVLPQYRQAGVLSAGVLRQALLITGLAGASVLLFLAGR